MGRKPKKPNELINLEGNDLYKKEIELGIRDSSGRHKLKKLSPTHIAIIEKHMSGLKNIEIAEEIGVTQVTVSRILNDPLARKYLEISYLSYEQELRGLTGAAIGVVREALGSVDRDIQLKAVDKYEKLVKLITPEGREISKGGSMSINISNGIAEDKKDDAIEKLMGRLESLAAKKPELFAKEKESEIVDIEVVEVEEEVEQKDGK